MLKTGLNEAQRIVEGDPFVSRGVVKATLMQFGLAAGTALAGK